MAEHIGVVGADASNPTLRDDAVDHLAQGAHRATMSNGGGKRQAVGPGDRKGHQGEEPTQDASQRLVHQPLVAGVELDPEQGVGRDLEGEVVGAAGHVHGFKAAPQRVGPVLGSVDHAVGEPEDGVAPEEL